MDELVKLVAEKTGISQEQAKIAVNLVLGALKERLPAPVASQLESLIGSEGGLDLAKGIGSLLG